MSVGIVGYGAFIPRRRIKLEEIAKVWGADAPSYKRGLQLHEKSVPGADEDTVTMSVEACRNALARSGGVDPAEIGALYIGSESHPYAVKPSGTVVSAASSALVSGATVEAYVSRGDADGAAQLIPVGRMRTSSEGHFTFFVPDELEEPEG